MTIYSKPRAELFAQDAPPSEIKPFAAWLRGLGIAFDETNGYPELESFNGLLQALNGYIKYLEQNGFAEWSSTLEYPTGAGVRVGSVWYRAKTQNTNKPPATSQNDWELFLNASALSYDNPIYIENNVVKVRDASTAQKGVVQFANATEVANRSNVSKAINPANVGQTFGASLSANGWCRLPNGLIFQWGKTSNIDVGGAGIQVNVTFPVAFPSACLNLQLTADSTGGSNPNAFASVLTKGRTSFSAYLFEYLKVAQSVGISWFAIGY